MSQSSKKPPAHVALLRGVNVGGKNILPMKTLAEMFSLAGCAEVRTYIQSGNVIFRAAPRVLRLLPAAVEEQIAARFGFRVPVILRSVEELAAVAANNPFLKTGALEKTLYVYFLAHEPKAADVSKLDPSRSAPDEFVVSGREIYARLPNGAAQTRLTNAYFDSRLATTSTARNWATSLKLLELARD